MLRSDFTAAQVCKITVARSWHTQFEAAWKIIKPFYLTCYHLSLCQALLTSDGEDWWESNSEYLSWAIEADKVDKIYLKGDEATFATKIRHKALET